MLDTSEATSSSESQLRFRQLISQALINYGMEETRFSYLVLYKFCIQDTQHKRIAVIVKSPITYSCNYYWKLDLRSFFDPLHLSKTTLQSITTTLRTIPEQNQSSVSTPTYTISSTMSSLLLYEKVNDMVLYYIQFDPVASISPQQVLADGWHICCSRFTL